MTTLAQDAYFRLIEDACRHLASKTYDLVIARCEEALKLDPEMAEAFFLLGLVAFENSDQGRAIELIAKAHEIMPECQDFVDALASIHTRIGNVNEGLYYAKLSLASEPHEHLHNLLPAGLRSYFEAAGEIGQARHHFGAAIDFQRGDYAGTIEKAGRELRINPRNAACHAILGRSLIKLGEYELGIASLHTAIHLEPENAEYRSHLGDALLAVGRFHEAMACHREAIYIDPQSLTLRSAYVAALAHLPGRKGLGALEEANSFNQLAREAAGKPTNFRSLKLDGRKLRIGYLSNNFKSGSELAVIEEVVKRHDRNKVQIYCYHQLPYEDFAASRLRSLVHNWRDIHDIDDDSLSMIVRADGIDVLVDLCGYSEGNRAALFAHRPAPVTIGWLGAPFGGGIEGMTNVLSDAMTLAADKAALGETAAIVMNKGLYPFVGESMSFAPKVGPSPFSENGFILFGGKCDFSRLNADTAALWARVLKAVPNSALYLGNCGVLTEQSMNRVQDMFAHFGMVDRVLFQATPEGEEANFCFLTRIDVQLDTHPVSNPSEVAEALWMGVPTVTLKGDRRSACWGASVLAAAGKGEWVAETSEDFVRIAHDLVADTDKLESIRNNLRNETKISVLCDTVGFTAELEAVYLSLATKVQS
jgi:protein O-GlcNAc transferase